VLRTVRYPDTQGRTSCALLLRNAEKLTTRFGSDKRVQVTLEVRACWLSEVHVLRAVQAPESRRVRHRTVVHPRNTLNYFKLFISFSAVTRGKRWLVIRVWAEESVP
jgi:hypothetical protein